MQESALPYVYSDGLQGLSDHVATGQTQVTLHLSECLNEDCADTKEVVMRRLLPLSFQTALPVVVLAMHEGSDVLWGLLDARN